MSRGVKITLIVLGILFVLGATCVGAGVYWWKKNGQGFLESAEASANAGQAFGADQENAEACIEEGLRQTSECGKMQISCVTGSQMFTQACFGAAPQDPSLCDGVPAPEDIVDSVCWTTARCQERGQTGNQFCSNVFSALQAHCQQAARR